MGVVVVHSRHQLKPHPSLKPLTLYIFVEERRGTNRSKAASTMSWLRADSSSDLPPDLIVDIKSVRNGNYSSGNHILYDAISV